MVIRTEWSPIQSKVIREVNKICGSPIWQSRVWLHTELDDTKSCYQLIITMTISENNKYSEDKCHRYGQCLRKKTSLTLEIPWFFFFFNFFFKTSDCCYGYCDQHYDWWIWPKGLSTIGCFNCPITGVQLKPIVRWHNSCNERIVSY